MGYALARMIQLTDMECGECGIVFAVPEDWRLEKKRTGHGWYCPNGHSRVYSESDAAKYKRLYEEEQARRISALARLNEAEAARTDVESELQRHKKRAANGVCPCCNRTFQDLARHMHSKHPAYGKTET